MLSYRHAFHAGNFADVLKHLVLVNTLHHATRKESPLFYLDTHAGAGRYPLQGKEAAQTGEAASGILKLDFTKLLAAASEEGVQALRAYREALQPFRERQQYPGSPLLAAKLLRRTDHLHFCELHPADYALLEANLQSYRNVRCEKADGYERATALVPPVQKRAVVLVDPSYELDSEYRQVVQLCSTLHRRMAAAQLLLWYPVVSRRATEQLIEALVRKEIRDLWRFELGVKADSNGHGMTASGMLVVNPPWTLPAQLENCLPLIQEQLAGGWGNWKVERLTPE